MIPFENDGVLPLGPDLRIAILGRGYLDEKSQQIVEYEPGETPNPDVPLYIQFAGLDGKPLPWQRMITAAEARAIVQSDLPGPESP